MSKTFDAISEAGLAKPAPGDMTWSEAKGYYEDVARDVIAGELRRAGPEGAHERLASLFEAGVIKLDVEPLVRGPHDEEG